MRLLRNKAGLAQPLRSASRIGLSRAGFTPPLKCGSKSSFSRAGFTLVELLLVAVLVPLIAFAIYANFNSGIKIWQRLNQQTGLEDLNIFSQKALKSLDGALNYSTITCEGDGESFSFASFIETEEKLGGDRGIGQTRLFYDPKQKAIKREQKNMSQVYKEASGKVDILLSGVSNFEMSYFTMNKQDKTYQWIEEWSVPAPPNELPVAVRMEFELSVVSDSRSVKKTFMIPAGG